MILTFGKYKGVSLEKVISEDPSYIVWAASKGLVDVDAGLLEEIIENEVLERRMAEFNLEMHCDNYGDR